MNIQDIRIVNYRQFVDANGGPASVAKTFDIDASYTSQLLNKHRPFGEKSARNIERKCGLKVLQLDHQLHSNDSSNVKNVNAVLNAVPKISWVQAGDVCDAEDHYEPGHADEWLICPVKHGKNTYVLEVVGDSMNSGEADGYLEGFDIFVDPDVNARHGDDVIVKTSDNKATFKRLQVTEDGQYLLALNKTWPNRIIQVPEDSIICGVIIYSGKSRKK